MQGSESLEDSCTGGIRLSIKKLSSPMIVVGGALAAFGFSGFSASVETLLGSLSGSAGWSIGSQIEITIGTALFLLGMSLRNQGSQ